MNKPVQNNKYRKFSDGWFSYYVNVSTGEKKFQLDPGDVEVTFELNDLHGKKRQNGHTPTQNNRYHKFSDGFFTYYVNSATGEKKFKLDPGDVEVEWEPDDFSVENRCYA